MHNVEIVVVIGVNWKRRDVRDTASETLVLCPFRLQQNSLPVGLNPNAGAGRAVPLLRELVEATERTARDNGAKYIQDSEYRQQ